MAGQGARVVLFSYGAFVTEVVTLLRDLGSTPVALVVPSNRSSDATHVARQDATAAGLPVLEQPAASGIEPFIRELSGLRPDLFLIWSYSMILPAELLRVPATGCVNVHGGLLPDYRGGHVLQWALINGETETGVTLHVVDEGIDTGPVIAVRRFSIEDGDDASTISAKLRDTGLSVLRDCWQEIASGTAAAKPQLAQGRYWPLRSDPDNRIDWRTSAVAIRNLVRALVAPWPGAYTTVGDKRLVVDAVDVLAGPSDAPAGTVLRVDEHALVVAALDAPLAIRVARIDGRLTDFRALGVAPGDSIGDRYPGDDAA